MTPQVTPTATSAGRRAPIAERDSIAEVGGAIAHLFAPGCEVAIYDCRGPGRVSFVAGESALRVGDPIGEDVRSLVANGESPHMEVEALPGGRVLKSSTVLLRGPRDDVEGAIRIRFDVTPYVRLTKTLLQLTDFDGATAQPPAFVADSFEETVQSVIAECLYEFGEGTGVLSRERKIELIGRLDKRGVFRVQNAVALVGELLGLSRATVYNYLRAARASFGGPSDESD